MSRNAGAKFYLLLLVGSDGLGPPSYRVRRLPLRDAALPPAAGAQSGMALRMDSSNMGTVNAVSPCWGL